MGAVGRGLCECQRWGLVAVMLVAACSRGGDAVGPAPSGDLATAASARGGTGGLIEPLRRGFAPFGAALAGAAERPGTGFVRDGEVLVSRTWQSAATAPTSAVAGHATPTAAAQALAAPHLTIGARAPLRYGGAVHAAVGTSRSAWLTLTPLGRAPAPGHLDDGRVVYPGVAPATDAILVSHERRVEEFLVLADQRAPIRFTYRVARGDLLVGARREPDGAVLLTDRAGVGRLRLPAPQARDAAGAVVPADQSLDGETLVVAVAPGPGTRYPVVLDPGVELATWQHHWATSTPGIRTGHAMAYDAGRQRVVLFGGTRDPLGNVPLGDLWELDPATGVWKQRVAMGKWPAARANHSLVYDGTQVLMFGGFDASFSRRSDLWQWNGTAWGTWQVAGSWPAGRSAHAAAYDVARGRMVIFGGWSGTGRLQDTWEWSGSVWTNPNPATKPSPRDGAAAAYFPTKGVYLFGGGADPVGGPNSQLYLWNGTNWALQTQSGSAPIGRFSHTLVYDSTSGGRLLLFGGDAYLPLSDVCSYAGTTWTCAVRAEPYATQWPVARSRHAMVFDSTRQRAITYGGENSEKLEGTWEWDPLQGNPTDNAGRWRELHPTAAWPPTVAGHSMAFDRVRGRLVVFTTNGTRQTWEWDPAAGTWADRTPAVLPADWPMSSSGHRLAYDPTRQKVLMFGGFRRSGMSIFLYNRLYEWDGAAGSWIDLTPATLPAAWPAPRSDHALAYDATPGRGKLVVFGGNTPSSMLGGTNDLWEWDSATMTWSDRTPSPLPAAWPSNRGSAAMDCDPTAGRCVSFGGYNGNTEFDETWEWNGASGTFVQYSPTIRPAARTDHALAFDAGRGRMVMFGGSHLDVLETKDVFSSPDVWEFDTTSHAWIKQPWPGGDAVSWPCARRYAALAYLPARGTVALLGGKDVEIAPMNDLWEYSVANVQLGSKCDASFPERCTVVSSAGYCTDGICCNVACDAPCYACNLAGLEGTCSPVPRGAPDPTASTPCTGAQACDGAGACKWASGHGCADGNECASGFCVDGTCCATASCATCQACTGAGGTCQQVAPFTDDDVCTDTMTCDAAGNCRKKNGRPCDAATPQECATGFCVEGYCCDSTCTAANMSCAVATNEGHCSNVVCQLDTDCGPAYYCNVGTGACVPDGARGDACATDSQCQSDHCADRVCCDVACSGTCERCDRAGSVGTCAPTEAGVDPRKDCQASVGGHTACAGTCSGDRQCVFPDTGTGCGVCAACDGTGRCTVVPADDDACGVIDCSGLTTACRSYSDLAANRCAALGACKAANDPVACTSYADLACADGAVGPTGDAGVGAAGGPGGGGGGCACTLEGRPPTALGALAALAVALLGRRRRAGRHRAR